MQRSSRSPSYTNRSRSRLAAFKTSGGHVARIAQVPGLSTYSVRLMFTPRVFQRRGSDIRTCLVVVALLRVYSGLSEHVNVSQLHSTRRGHLAFGAEVTR